MPFTIIVKSSVSHAWQGSEGFEYVLENTLWILEIVTNSVLMLSWPVCNSLLVNLKLMALLTHKEKIT